MPIQVADIRVVVMRAYDSTAPSIYRSATSRLTSSPFYLLHPQVAMSNAIDTHPGTLDAESDTNVEFYRDPTMGDFVIRSSEGVDFYVHKDVIARASHTFSDMVSLPQPPDAPLAKNGKSFVDTEEASHVWTHVIPLCYFRFPAFPTPITELNVIRTILEAGRKYQISSVIECVRRTLLDGKILDSSPLEAYALACTYELGDVARAAARASLKQSIYFSYSQSLEELSIRQFHLLFKYRQECSAAAQAAVLWPRGDSVPRCFQPKPWMVSGDPASITFSAPGQEQLAVPHYTAQAPNPLTHHIYISRVVITYLEGLGDALAWTPDPALANSEERLHPIIQAGTRCSGYVLCINRRLNDLQGLNEPLTLALVREKVDRFSLAVHDEVEKAITKVRKRV